MADDFSALVAEQKETNALLKEQIMQNMTEDEKFAADRAEAELENAKFNKKRDNTGTKQLSVFTKFHKFMTSDGSDKAEDDKKKGFIAKKTLDSLDSIKKGIKGIFESGKAKIKSGFKTIGSFLLGAAFVAILAFLNSPMFEKVRKEVLNVLVPALASIFDFIVEYGIIFGQKILKFLKDIRNDSTSWYDVILENKVVIASILFFFRNKILKMFRLIYRIITFFGGVVGKAVKVYKAIRAGYIKKVFEKLKKQLAALGSKLWKFMSSIVTSLKAFRLAYIKEVFVNLKKQVAMLGGKLWKFMRLIPVLLVAIKTFFLATMIPALLAFSVALIPLAIPIAIIVGIVAAAALIIATLKKSFDDFMFELEATGSIWEATKTGIVSIISNILGLPFDLLKDGVSWIIGKIGSVFGLESFTNASKVLDDFSFVDMMKDMLTFLGDSISGIFDGFMQAVQDFLRSGLLGKFGGSKVADKLFGTKEEQVEKKKAKEEEQKQFELNRKALKEKQKLEKEALEAEKLKKAKEQQVQASSASVDPRSLAGPGGAAAPIVVNAPATTNVSAPNTTNMSSASTSMINTDRVFDKLSAVR